MEEASCCLMKRNELLLVLVLKFVLELNSNERRQHLDLKFYLLELKIFFQEYFCLVVIFVAVVGVVEEIRSISSKS